jgi:hypothetical protein
MALDPTALVGRRVTVEGKGTGVVKGSVKRMGRSTLHRILFDEDGREEVQDTVPFALY